MTRLPLTVVRSNLSSLVKRAARGTPIGVTVRGRVEAYLVSAETVEARTTRKKPKLRGSMKLRGSLDGSRDAFLRWLRGEG
jgi:prevent-host-death family protein